MSRKDNSTTLRVADLAAPRSFELRPDEDDCRAMAERLGLLALRKLTFAGEVRPDGARGARLDARLGATVVQACGVTLEPVSTRIDEDVLRRYVPDLPDLPQGDEIEMPEDVEVEAMPRALDLALVMEEALSLALPMFPRAPGAGPADISVTEPGRAPMTDADARPFAVLAGLRDKLGGKGE